jgi:hypothetical protein
MIVNKRYQPKLCQIRVALAFYQNSPLKNSDKNSLNPVYSVRDLKDPFRGSG